MVGRGTWKTAADDSTVCNQQSEQARGRVKSQEQWRPLPRSKQDGVCMAGCRHWAVNLSGISRTVLSAGIVRLMVIRLGGSCVAKFTTPIIETNNRGIKDTSFGHVSFPDNRDFFLYSNYLLIETALPV